MIKMQLHSYEKSVEAAIADADKDNLVERLWARDYQLWSDSPEEISNRLGWLDIADRMKSEITELNTFAKEIANDGISKVLLLGMGGSSLAPEVFSRIFQHADGFPTLSILDSTDSDAMRSKMDAHEPQETLYVVSTKSGGTVETMSFFKHFYNQCLESMEAEHVGRHFIAISDPKSKLAELAEEYSFRRTFLNDPNIGGRYSALSYFGLVPAALLGIDLERLLDEAIDMSKQCKNQTIADNPGARLGLTLATLAEQGLDKLSIMASAEYAAFGDWLEQLIAESTGKAGKGILPVLGTRISVGQSYGKDRLFTFMGAHSEQAIKEVKQKEHPTITLDWEDPYEIGAQIFLWEFATAVAGYALQIHPFNQPNVESAKILAREMVDNYIAKGKLPEIPYAQLSGDEIKSTLTDSKEGDYVALQAYTEATGEAKELLEQMKLHIEKSYGLATTIGFGPRFLHSTGQLHKGDGGNGIFLQFISAPSERDIAIPLKAGSDESQISFDILKEAQAAGDASALLDAGRRVKSFAIQGSFVDDLEKIYHEMIQ